MGRWWTGYTSISAGRLGIAHSHGEPWLFAATERLQPAYGYGLWKAKIPSEKMCSIAVCRGAGCELKDLPLGLSPLLVWKAEQITGLPRLLTLALRLLTLWETQVRRGLEQTQEAGAGLYEGAPTRTTERPTGTRLLQAFARAPLTLTHVRMG